MQKVSEVLGKGLKVQSVAQEKIKKHCQKLGLSFKDFDEDKYAPNDCMVYLGNKTCKIEIEHYQKPEWNRKNLNVLKESWHRGVSISKRRKKESSKISDIWLKVSKNSDCFIAVNLKWLFSDGLVQLAQRPEYVRRDHKQGEDRENNQFYEIPWKFFDKEENKPYFAMSDQASELFRVIQNVLNQK